MFFFYPKLRKELELIISIHNITNFNNSLTVPYYILYIHPENNHYDMEPYR